MRHGVRMTSPHHDFRIPSVPGAAVSDDLRRRNLASVARRLLVDGPLARSELAERLSLTRATVTRVTAQLLDVGLLTEGEAQRAAAGRPLVPLELDGSGRQVLSVHIGAIEVRVGLVDITGHVVAEERFPYVGTSPREVAHLISDGVALVRASAPKAARLLGVSASIGGWVDPVSHTIVSYEPLGWRDVPLGEVIPDFGIPRRFDQLLRGLALAERMFGAARGRDDFVVLWTGNVLGAASVWRGDVQTGLRGGSGDIDHLPTGLSAEPCGCGRQGCLHTVCTDDAIRAEALRRGILRPRGSLRTFVEIVSDGDAAARDLLDERARAFGRAAGIVADFRAPSLFILAGLITTAPGYAASFADAIAETSELGATAEIRQSGFGDLAPTIASAAFLIDEYFRDPLLFEQTPSVTSLP